MVAQHVVNPDQLQLFVDPEEHMERIKGSTDQEGRTVEHVWEQKEREARLPRGTPSPWDPSEPQHGAGLVDALRSGEGVRKPVHVVLEGYQDKPGPVQWEGHHRIAAAAAVQRENKAAGVTNPHVYVPVEHHLDMNAALGAQFGIRMREHTPPPTGFNSGSNYDDDDDYYEPTPDPYSGW